MNRIYKKWMAIGMSACFVTLASCKDNQDASYNGSLDLNLLALTQALDVWNGTECNVTTYLMKEDTKAKNFTYNLNLSLYQQRTAQKDAAVDLSVATDSLNRLIAMNAQDGVYAKYAGARLLPEEYYQLSGKKLTLTQGSTLSEDISLTVFSNELISQVQKEGKDACFVLPLKVENSSSYTINPKVNAMMFFFYVTYVQETIDPASLPEEEEPAIGDAYGDTELKLVWHDEFNGTGIPDPTVWRFEEGFQRNEELQWYSDQNGVCEDGALVITGRKEQVKNTNYDASATGGNAWKKTREYAEYTSSCIVSSYRFRKGTMVVRAKIPTAMGAWPAIWTTGCSSDSWCWEWPMGGEIDLLEYYLVNGVQSLHANACWASDTRWSATWDSYNCPLTDFTADDPTWADKYHIWRMDWDDDYIRLYLDDKLMNEIDLSKTSNGTNGLSDWWRGSWRNPFKDAGNDGENFGQQIYLNLAIGSNGGTPDDSQFPLKCYFDYVRIYQK